MGGYPMLDAMRGMAVAEWAAIVFVVFIFGLIGAGVWWVNIEARGVELNRDDYWP